MPTAQRAIVALIFLWAGACISGNLIAAPAKFTVDALDLSLALQVGRAQFTWIGYFEWLLGIVLVVLASLARWRLPLLVIVAIGVFLIQQIFVQPMLEARSDLIIAGAPYDSSSHGHLIFVALEVLKVTCLLIAGWSGARPGT